MEKTRKIGTFVQVGTAQLRRPDGTLAASEPIYMEVQPGKAQGGKTGAFLQAGQVAARDAEGKCQPAQPLYMEATETTEREERGQYVDFGRFCVQAMRRYRKECEAAGLQI